MSIGNIHANVQNKPSCCAWVLVGLLPVTKYPNTNFYANLAHNKNVLLTNAWKAKAKAMPGIMNNQLFHKCMKIVLGPLWDAAWKPDGIIDNEGGVHVGIPILMAWIADLEEQWLICGLTRQNCPCCKADSSAYGLGQCCKVQKGQSTLQKLQCLQAALGGNQIDNYKFDFEAWQIGLLGVQPSNLCWEGLGVNICQVVCVDILHGLHKFVHNHLLVWVTNIIGKGELDCWFWSQPYCVGYWMFGGGILKMKQMSGKENCNVECHLVTALVHAQSSNHVNLPDAFFTTVCALLDFIFKAQLKTHSNATIASMKADLATFHANKHVFLTLGGQIKSNSNPMDHFNIPKLHHWTWIAYWILYGGLQDTSHCLLQESLHCQQSQRFPHPMHLQSTLLQDPLQSLNVLPILTWSSVSQYYWVQPSLCNFWFCLCNNI